MAGWLVALPSSPQDDELAPTAAVPDCRLLNACVAKLLTRESTTLTGVDVVPSEGGSGPWALEACAKEACCC